MADPVPIHEADQAIAQISEYIRDGGETVPDLLDDAEATGADIASLSSDEAAVLLAYARLGSQCQPEEPTDEQK